ncbi:PREDICTED: uncharacterized protein LOC104746347 [Camelina sativa]|uniref:Uncharacterized protein LOC104746347 n=1 Tax=Camelina sativa TaxID=90675 RepID=A0ABM0W5U4_CAMSA|nr:PREDICTED: uncharacterized protein LOC104746347 [Camelina sativa]
MQSILRSLAAQGYIYRGGRSAVSRQSRNFCSSNVAGFNEAGRGRFISAAAAWWNSVSLFDGFVVGSGCYAGYELIRVFKEYMISKRAQEELDIRAQLHNDIVSKVMQVC